MKPEAVSETCSSILAEVERAVVGKRTFLEKLLCSLLVEAHVLIEDLPGLAKTLTARSFAAVLGLTFRRIQFTPDLLPADVTGAYVLNRASGSFELVKGPIFANLVLGDEINRAPPKTQAALLEAMEERQATLEGETHLLPRPFFVVATQNPIEYEGTFPLPEAQLDRFTVRLRVGYPEPATELEILARRRKRRVDEVDLKPVAGADTLLQMREAVEGVTVDDDVAAYMVALCQATRRASQVAVGASPRASLALLKLSRARAAMEGREFVVPDDVKYLAHEVLDHRLILKPDVWAAEVSTYNVVEGVLRAVEVPKVALA